ncbi:helix-turn-helix transcriptional regulator [Runella aurantiaca]|uniref:AraC family transcriptional regulator n=1 Tax=Runella aurantiaca TaxID=2282308 RepID=A0A369ICM7_9BACT|nr:helix-turn-helix domain-containing protein [Runella aurantiaca]RDB06025.1 AraC family transcriptional regulator [Runella aurantiaca]
MKKNILIPNLKPSEFDDYLFAGWRAPISGFYDRFHVSRIEDYKNHLTLPLLPHRRSVCFFIFLTKGKVIRSKGLSNYEIIPDSFFFLAADQITSLEYVSPDAEGFYCHFLPEIFNHSALKIDFEYDFPFFQITGEPLLKVSDKERVMQLLHILENENYKNREDRFGVIPLYLHALLSELKLQLEPTGQKIKNASAHLTQRYKNALSEFIYDKKTVAEFADYLAVTPNHLHKCIKTTTGKSAHHLLEDMRILEAKVLLKQTNLTIGEIAFKIGRFEPSDFSRFFRINTGITPSAYRQG